MGSTLGTTRQQINKPSSPEHSTTDLKIADEIKKDQDTPSSLEHSTTDLEMADEIKKDQGFHECEVSTSTDPTQAEADLQAHFTRCQKNPGHKDFIPVKRFSIEHIPNRYRDIDMFNFIRAWINLTLRITVRLISEKRPETFPGTDKPYPFYNKRGKKCLKYGTGMVWKVWNYTDEKARKHGEERKTCPCVTCRSSPTPMTQWYKIRVTTALHVVFDSIEAQHATCQLFYDSDEAKDKIQEFKGEQTWGNGYINYDVCVMCCCIHDLELGKKLEEMWKVFDNLRRKLLYKFKNSVIEHPLTVIVSHPHGCSKQVTIGEMEHREDEPDELGLDWKRYTYTTQTCPGSSGAPVFVVGKSGKLHKDFHPHSQRCTENGLNMSVLWLG